MAIQKKTYTYAEYTELTHAPENADRILELVDGEIVEQMPSFTPSKIAARISYYVTQYNITHNIGYVTGADGGYVMSDDNTFIPDVGYIAKVRLPVEPEREVPVPPDLAVEVKSPTDSKRMLRQKAEKYLYFGTKLVWLIFPDDQIVEVYYLDEDVQTYGQDATLDGKDILPGFTLPVQKIFT